MASIRQVVRSASELLNGRRWAMAQGRITSSPASIPGPSIGSPAAAASNSSPPKISDSALADLATARREGERIAITFHDETGGRLVSYAVSPDVAASLAAAVAFALARR